jgi:hypothetical protein
MWAMTQFVSTIENLSKKKKKKKIRGTANLAKLKSIKKIWSSCILFRVGHFKSWWWTIRICKENSRKFPMNNTKVAIKKIIIENLFKLTKKHHPHNALPHNSEKRIIVHHAQFFRGTCQRSYLAPGS